MNEDKNKLKLKHPLKTGTLEKFTGSDKL